MPEEQTGLGSEEIGGTEGNGVKKSGSQAKECDFIVSGSSHVLPGWGLVMTHRDEGVCLGPEHSCLSWTTDAVSG